MLPGRVQAHFEKVHGRPMTDGEWAAAFTAALTMRGGNKKAARAMFDAACKQCRGSEER